MAKKYRKHRKGQPKWLLPVLIGLVALLVAMLVVNAFLPKTTASNGTAGWVLTEDGHIHDANGNHISTYEEMFGTPWEGFASPTDLTGDATPTDLPADAPAAE